MRMDEHEGKEFLAAVRSADYAHAGEGEAIDLVFSHLNTQPTSAVLDVGCGRGGTADYVKQRGWGEVFGIDIDSVAIEYAKSRYPSLKFSICDMCKAGEEFPAQFDLIYLFNVFYTANDKGTALRSLRKAARDGGILAIFDYVSYKPDEALPAVFLGQKPATPDELANFSAAGGWDVFRNVNLDEKYIEWYRNFLLRFDAPALQQLYKPETIHKVRSLYAELLNSLERGILGGILLLARAV